MEKKKILYLITKSNWGGAQRYVFDLATNMDIDKFEPVVALGGSGVLKEQLEHSGIKVIEIKSLGRDISVTKEIAFIRELWKILRREKPQILHVNSSKAGGVGCLLGRAAFIPKVIFTAHGWAFNEDRASWKKLIIKFFHWITVLLSHKTIAVSSAVVRQMNWPLAQKKMRIINPGRTIGAMYKREEARAKILDFCPRLLPYSTDDWIVCVAELHPIKRHNILIQSMKILIELNPQIRLICIGDGEERGNLEEQIAKLSLQNNVFILGQVTEAARFMKAFDLFVLASKSESYGYVVHEAGLAEVPIVVTKVGGIGDIVGNNNEGTLVAPDNCKTLSDALRDNLNNKNLAKTRASNLYKKLKGRDVKSMTEKTSVFYELRFD